MNNIKITIEAPELAAAISNLAAALSRKQLASQMQETMPTTPQANFTPPVPQTIPQTVAASMVSPAVIPAQPAPVAPAASSPVLAIPVETQSYTMEQLAVAATQLNDAGRRQDLVNLLAAFGVSALTQLSKEQYGAFATQLRAMGAKI